MSDLSRLVALERSVRREAMMGGAICVIALCLLAFVLFRPLPVKPTFDKGAANCVLRALYEARNPPPPGPHGPEPTDYDYKFGKWRNEVYQDFRDLYWARE